MEFLYSDCETLLTEYKQQEKQLRLKRRWLMGLDMSNSRKNKLKERNCQKDRTIPESLLREDDVSYETIKTLVEGGFEASNDRTDHQVGQESMNLFDLERKIFFLLDNMSNKGLYLLAETLTGGSTKFELVRQKLKKIIRENLPIMLRNQNDSQLEKISQLLIDPKNFRDDFIKPSVPAYQESFNGQKYSQNYRDITTEVLNSLEDLPFLTLRSMYRKLKGYEVYAPQFNAKKSGWARGNLTDKVRKSCNEILSELEEEDELPEPFSKAMAVAGLSLKLLGRSFETEFQKFSRKTKALQNEIAKAIGRLKKLRFQELRNLRLLLDPNGDSSDRSFRSALRNLLTEYLLECSDMDSIPESLLSTLAIINRSGLSGVFSKKDIEEEVECVLGVSAQIKQIVWDFVPEHEFDRDYVNAYLEKSDETDDSDDFVDNEDEKQEELPKNGEPFYSDDQVEGTGETNPTNSASPKFTVKGNGSSAVLEANKGSQEDEHDHMSRINGVDLSVSASTKSLRKSTNLDKPGNIDGKLGPSDPSSLQFTTNGSGSSPSFSSDVRLRVESDEPKIEANIIHDKESSSGTHYLALQEACDETSMVAYRLVGCMMDEFAQIEGYDLDDEDISYLRNNDLTRKDSRVAKEDEISQEEDVRGSILIRVLEELIPSFPVSGKERVKELMGLK